MPGNLSNSASANSSKRSDKPLDLSRRQSTWIEDRQFPEIGLFELDPIACSGVSIREKSQVNLLCCSSNTATVLSQSRFSRFDRPPNIREHSGFQSSSPTTLAVFQSEGARQQAIGQL